MKGGKDLKGTVTIIIVNWNAREMLKKCLSSIFQNTTYPAFRVVVVDNASTDESVEMIRREFRSVAVVENDDNLGFSAGNNIGIDRYRSEFYFLLNNDTEVKPGWLGTSVDMMNADRKIGIIGSLCVFPSGKVQHAGGYNLPGAYSRHAGKGLDPSDVQQIKDYPFVSGAALLIRREVLDTVGLLDEGFSPYYFEDSDLCYRARFANYRVVYNPKSAIVHHESVSTKKVKDAFRQYVTIKNRTRFVLLNLQGRDLVVWLPHHFYEGMRSVYEGWFPSYLRAHFETARTLVEIYSKRRERMRWTI